MKRLILLIASILALNGCSDPTAATKALDDLGFSDVRLTGYRFLSCGKDYTFHTGFEARNPRGKPVSGTVCSGWFKGSSVKFD